MVEVFKTNVEHQHEAEMLIDQIQKAFVSYIANFDLEDCDRILRIKCTAGLIKASDLIEFVNEFGFHAEVLSDEPLTLHTLNISRGAVCRN